MAPVSEEAICAAKSRDSLLFPGPNEGDVVERSLHGKTKVQLQDMCTEYKLPRTAPNKTTLEDRLKQYSERFCAEPEACRLALTQSGARRSHKGRQDQATHTKVKLSDARRADLVNTTNTTERSKDLRTERDRNEMLAWARRTTARLPYKPPRAIDASTRMLPPAPAASVPTQTIVPALNEQLRNIQDQLDVLITSGWGTSRSGYGTGDWGYAHTPAAVPGFGFNEGVTADTANTSTSNATAWIDASMANSTMDPRLLVEEPLPNMFSEPVVTVPPPPPHEPVARDRHLILGNGTVFSVTSAEINALNITSTSFAKDIASLDAMWDDTSADWSRTSPIVIRDQPIALRYWRDLFVGTGLWPAHKSAWNEWKFLVSRYRLGTADEFWAAFTRDGKRMTFSSILKQLRQERKERDKEIAERARFEYGNEFSSTFSYHNSRTGAREVMKKDTAIAKEYMKLRGFSYVE